MNVSFKSIAIAIGLQLFVSQGYALNTKGVPKGFKQQESQALSFTENKGQIHDQDYKNRHDVLFGGSANGMVFHLRNNGISYQLNRVDSWKEEEDLKTKDKRKVIDQSTIYRVDINWINSNENATVIKNNALVGENNYYLESCPNGALNVKSYQDVEYLNLYSGINLKWYQKEGQLKYDYIVAPNADYKQIQLQINGAELKLQDDGSLILTTPLGKIEEQAPVVYQNGNQLKAKWILSKKYGELSQTISFEIENYDPTQELIIDPVVRLWGTYYGDAGNENTTSIASDASGNVFMSGNSNSTTGINIATVGSHQVTFGGGSNDAFLVKFDASGTRQWGTLYGGSGTEYGSGCATDASGNVYLAGASTSTTSGIIATVGSHLYASPNNNNKAFLVKFNSSGIRQWGTYYGGETGETGYCCATDASGNIYLGGYTQSTTGIATAGSHQTTSSSGFDCFLVKFNSSGVRQWGTYYGGIGNDFLSSCATDPSGNVCLSGYTSTTGGVFATAGCHQPVFGGGTYDAFLAKFNSSGVRQWGTNYGDVDNDFSSSCTMDLNGNVYLCGTSNNSTGTVIATPGSHQATSGGGDDAFLVKFNSSGVRQWGTYYGGAGYDNGGAVTTNLNGDVFLAGMVASSSGTVIATPGSYQPVSLGGSRDPYFVKFNSNGIRQWGTYYSGTGGIGYGTACAVDASGNAYIGGYTEASGMASAGSQQPTSGGQQDCFLAKLTDCSLVAPTVTVNSNLCVGVSINFTVNVSGTVTPTYNWAGPNSFTSTVQNSSIANAGTVNSGTYTLTVNTGGGCAEIKTISINVNASPTITVNSGTICSGTTFTIVPGGASTYTIQGATATVSPLTTADFTVVGTSTAGCVSANTATSNVTVNATPTISVISGTICTNNSFTITPSGASTYTIQGGSATVSPLSNANYTVVGTSSAGCVSANTATANITVNTTPTISVSNGTICAGTNFTIVPIGASTYTFQGGSAAVTPSTTTSYTVVGKSALGCISANTATTTVTVNAAPTVTVNSGLICNGNSFTLTPSGAATYTYSSGSAIVTPTINSTYTVSVTGTNGCQNTAVSTITVTQLTSTIAQTNNLCNGASLATATVTAANGTSAYNYTWSPSGGNTNVATGLTAGTYSCLITDANNCKTTQTLVITEPTPLNIAVASSSILCKGGISSVSVSATGGVSPYLNTGSYTVSAGNYSYTVTDNNGCTKSNTIAVTEPSLLTSSLTASTILCYGNLSSVVVTGNGGTLPYTGAGSFSVAANNYTYTVTDANGCAATSTVTITQPTIIQSAQTVTLCAGSSLIVGTNTYTTSGYYTDVLAASNGCDSTVTTNLTVYPQVTNTQSFTICAGQSFNIGSSNYTTSGTYTNTTLTTNGCTANIITNLIVRPAIVKNQTITICANQNYVIGASTYSIAGTYSNVFTAANGCDSTVLTNLIVKPISSKTQNVSICVGQKYTIGTSNYTTAGTYTNVLQAVNSCDSIVVTHLFVNPLPNVTVNSGEICFGNSFSITASGANTYSYSGGNIVTPNQTTTYTVVGTVINGCSNQAISTVSVNVLPTIELGDDITIVLGESHMFTPQLNNAVTYTWTTANGLDNPFIANSTSSVQTNTTYTLTVTSAKGCIASDIVSLKIYDDFFISNFVSPNGDGDNDTWKASAPYLIKDFALEIVDQWGNKVFSVPNNYTNNWDGTNNGKAVPDGVYYYIFSEAGKVKYTGSINVLR